MEELKKTEHIIANDIGDAHITVYNVFPGIQLVYHSVHMDEFDLGFATEGNLIEIHHCREGRIEQKFDDEYFYLMPGDLSVALRTQVLSTYKFPLRHYHGITIGINMDQVIEAEVYPIMELNLNPLGLAQKLCGERKSYIIRSEKYIEHLFSELYSVPDSIKESYFKVKVLELLVILSGKEQADHQQPIQMVPLSQVQNASQISEYLSEHLKENITIPELSKQFNVSETHLKNLFKNVYGVPIATYMRIQKMQAAAQVLIHTDRPVAEIAYEFGYNNTSKFTSAFQKIIGDTPSEYRKMHTKCHK